MLTESATIKVKINDRERDIRVTPLFLQNQTESWEPNELFDLEETGNNSSGEFVEFAEPVKLGKIIVNDQKEWRYEGDGDMDDTLLEQLAGFVLGYDAEE